MSYHELAKNSLKEYKVSQYKESFDLLDFEQLKSLGYINIPKIKIRDLDEFVKVIRKEGFNVFEEKTFIKLTPAKFKKLTKHEKLNERRGDNPFIYFSIFMVMIGWNFLFFLSPVTAQLIVGMITILVTLVYTLFCLTTWFGTVKSSGGDYY